MARKPDTFLIDAVKRPQPPLTRLGYLDGFRFGFGFFIAGLLVALILSLLSWVAWSLMHLS